MLNTFIEARKSRGNRNVDFKFENILELISPKKVIEDIKQTRKEIAYIYSKYEELDEGNPKKLEYGDRLNAKFEEASQNYSNVLGMLPLAIEDIKTRLLLGHDENSLKSEKIKLGMLQVGDKGELEVIEYKQEDFINIAKPLIEKLLGVKIFFEQYNDNIINETYIACNKYKA